MSLKNYLVKAEEKIKYYLFTKKIENRNKLFVRKIKREMEEDELQSYKFYLFTVYSIFLILPIILIWSIVNS